MEDKNTNEKSFLKTLKKAFKSGLINLKRVRFSVNDKILYWLMKIFTFCFASIKIKQMKLKNFLFEKASKRIEKSLDIEKLIKINKRLNFIERILISNNQMPLIRNLKEAITLEHKQNKQNLMQK